MGKFKDLRVWNDAVDLAEKIYRITQEPLFSKDFALRDQIRRAVVSISSNIAEADERGSNRESMHFFNIAKGSAAEVITQLNIANRIGYLESETLQLLEDHAEKIRASLKKLIQSRGGNNPVVFIGWFILSLVKLNSCSL